MSNSKLYSRREFIKLSSLALAAMPVSNIANPLLPFTQPASDDLKIFIFSKSLQFLDYNDMCSAAKEIGFDGVDLTVRPKGHVLPENVEEQLPKVTEIMKTYNLDPSLITTNVKDSQNPIDKKVLEVATKLGYNYYRTGWYKYSDETNIIESSKIYDQNLVELAKLNKELGITGCYQNHSGHNFGSSIWELNQTLTKLSPTYMGNQFDIMHATIEGGINWELGLALIKDRINSIVIKDFKWEKVNGTWEVIKTPLSEGMVNFTKYFSLLKRYNINVPVSVHFEYDLGGAEHGKNPTMPQKEIFNKMKKDISFIRTTWANTK